MMMAAFGKMKAGRSEGNAGNAGNAKTEALQSGGRHDWRLICFWRLICLLGYRVSGIGYRVSRFAARRES
jgi:hypothetical protein